MGCLPGFGTECSGVKIGGRGHAEAGLPFSLIPSNLIWIVQIVFFGSSVSE